MTRQKKREQREREQLFAAEEQDQDEDDEEEDEEEEKSTSGRGSSKRKTKHRRGEVESDSEDDKDAGVWADNEAEAMLGPEYESKVTCSCSSTAMERIPFIRVAAVSTVHIESTVHGFTPHLREVGYQLLIT